MISFIAIILALALGVIVGAIGYSILYFYKLGNCETFYQSQRMILDLIGAHHPTTEETS
jgi:hypothetical protein